MSSERPAFGAETEIALALINLTDALTFSESPSPSSNAFHGEYTTITCTKTADMDPPFATLKPLRSGLNHAAQLIPDHARPGRLSFTVADAPRDNVAMQFHERPCVARLKTRIDNDIMRTYYCTYFVPSVKTAAPEGDEVGAVAVEGEFHSIFES